MTRIHLVFFDAGGGHRSAALALKEAIAQQHRPWEVELVNLQELLDPLDVFRRVTGVRLQDMYNKALKRGWTRGSRQLMLGIQALIRLYHRQEVQLLERFWRDTPTDLVVSVVPHFNRALFESLGRSRPQAPFVTLMTDLADVPPHFWIERQNQYLVCATERAMEQAAAKGYSERQVFRISGMVLHPRFYEAHEFNRDAERSRLGLDPHRATGLVLFGGEGSRKMLDIATELDRSGAPVQLIMLCGHNRKLAMRLRGQQFSIPVHVEEFTREVPYFMRLSDFFIGKPGPGSISEALAMGLPVIVERNPSTLPQERYNCEWLRQNGLGIVIRRQNEIAGAVNQLLDPGRYAEFKARVKAHCNGAVFEVPAVFERILREHTSAPEARD